MHFLERDERRALKFEKFIGGIEEPLFTQNFHMQGPGPNNRSIFSAIDNGQRQSDMILKEEESRRSQ